MIDDIDKAQSTSGLMEVLIREATRKDGKELATISSQRLQRTLTFALNLQRLIPQIRPRRL